MNGFGRRGYGYDYGYRPRRSLAYDRQAPRESGAPPSSYDRQYDRAMPPRGGYGGLRSDGLTADQRWDSAVRRGFSDFSTGGGTYDVEYSSGRDWVADRSPTQRWGGEVGRTPQRERTGERSSTSVTAGDIMTANPEAVTVDERVREVAKLMRDMEVGIIPVLEDAEGRKLVGVVTDRDLTVRVLAAGRSGRSKVGDCVTEDVETVRRDATAEEILAVMARRQIRRVPVVDDEGALIGIVAQADLAVDYAAGDCGAGNGTSSHTLQRISAPARPNWSRRSRG